MEKIVDKIDSYNIFTNIIPGAVFVQLLSTLNLYTIQIEGIIETVILYYFFGVIAGRIGSLIIGGILKSMSMLKHVPREDYLKATAKDTEIKKLLEANNMYRTFAGVFLALGCCKLINALISLPSVCAEWLGIVALLILFVWAYIKQTANIVVRVEAVNNNESTEN